MNAEAQVLQCIDAVQDSLRRMRSNDALGHKDRLAAEALTALDRAPWSMIARPREADQHGWLTDLREALEQIVDDPESDASDQALDRAIWCAAELERDVRDMVGAR